MASCAVFRRPKALAGKGFFFDGLTHNSYPISYPTNPDCEWHEPAAPIVAAKEISSDTPFTVLAELARQKLGGWKSAKRPAYRKFPGPPDARAPLRIAFEAGAYADFIAHAKSFLDVEICGVLVGNVQEDDEGVYVHVKAIIQGEQARQSGTHVTFTQETWTNIHETRERHYAKMQILGWYHTHPGFGVEFSDMDLFIQRNFFSGATQFALLTDPLSGEVAVCFNTPEGTAPLDKFWVSGREVRCYAPPTEETRQSTSTTQYASADIQALETRLNQFIQQADQQKNWLFSLVSFAVILILVAVVGWVGHSIYRYYTDDPFQTTVKNLNTVPIPVQIDGKRVILIARIIGVESPTNFARRQPQPTLRQPENKPRPDTSKHSAASDTTKQSSAPDSLKSPPENQNGEQQ